MNDPELHHCANCDDRTDPHGRDGGHSWCRKCRVKAAIDEFNATAPVEEFYGEKSKIYARLPILATDCDYEIVRISGVQGVRLAA